MSDLFSHGLERRAAKPKKDVDREAARRASVPHRCAVCGAFAPYGRGLPHKGERVVYYCREHEPR